MSKKTWKALEIGRCLKREPERTLKLLLPWVRFSILGKLELWILTAFWGGRGRNQHLVAPKLRSLRGGSLHLAGPTESDNSELGWNRSKIVSVSPPRDSESFPCLAEQEGGRDFPVVQWLRLHAFHTVSTGSIPGWRAEILNAIWCSQKIKRERK